MARKEVPVCLDLIRLVLIKEVLEGIAESFAARRIRIRDWSRTGRFVHELRHLAFRWKRNVMRAPIDAENNHQDENDTGGDRFVVEHIPSIRQ